MSHKDIIERWYSQVWVQGCLDQIDTFFTPDFTAAGIVPGLQLGPGDFRDLVETVRSKIDHLQIDLRGIVEQGDWISAVLLIRARERHSGRPLSGVGQMVARIENGRFAECFNQFDFLTFFEQIGQLPPNTLETLLVGQTLEVA
ncbi:MAG: ester cyclase [Marinibacterium sp.]|nr:ester cyclase [Marinibacterium sp.]